MSAKPKSITIVQAAQLLNLSEPEIHRLIRTNRLRQLRTADCRLPTEPELLLEDLLTQLELHEYDRQIAQGATEKQAQRTAESHRHKINCQLSIDNLQLTINPPATNQSSVVNSVPPRSRPNPKFKIANPKSVPPLTPSPSHPLTGGQLSALPLTFIPVREAAFKLNLSKSSIYRLIESGRLNSDRAKNGRLTVLESDIEAYKDLQEVWQSKAGRWTRYGRQESSPHMRTYLPENNCQLSIDNLQLTINPASNSQQDFWMTTQEAAAYLALSPIRIGALGRQGKLTRHIAHTSPDGRSQYQLKIANCQLSIYNSPTHPTTHTPKHRGRPPATWYLFSSVRALAAKRDHAASSTGKSPNDYNHNLLHPIIRTTLEPPPNDELITRAYAASILNVSPSRISVLVQQGRLFAWQTHPGKPGCPLYLSMNQIWRYSHDPERLRRKSNQFLSSLESLASLPNDPTTQRLNHQPSTIHHQPEDEDPRFAFKSNTGDSNIRPDRDHGEFYSTKQTAEVLKISCSSVGKLRKRGRLTGYHSHGRRSITQSPNHSMNQSMKWWFYRKEDVDNLLLDRQYREGRERARKGMRTRWGN